MRRVHLADRIEPPSGYAARPYAGPGDHAAMADALNAYRRAKGDPELVLAEHLDHDYANLTDCDPTLDIAVLERDGQLVGYARPSRATVPTGLDLIVFAPVHPDHLDVHLFTAIADAEELHLRKWLTGAPARYRAYAGHPGPGQAPVGEAAWLEARGYTATEWSATLRRPHLDDVPDLPLPAGVDVRPVETADMGRIVREHNECFRDEWDFDESEVDEVGYVIDDPNRDETLWQVAWHGDRIVGQVKPFINHAENAERGYRRAYTEFISTHREYRNRGIAQALLARALVAVRERGMTEAVLGVDTNNAGGAFQLYTKLGFELESYEAVYTRRVDEIAVDGAGADGVDASSDVTG